MAIRNGESMQELIQHLLFGEEDHNGPPPTYRQDDIIKRGKVVVDFEGRLNE